MTITKEQYQKTKIFIEAHLKVITDAQIKLVSSLLEFEIDKVEIKLNSSDSAWIRWERLTPVNILTTEDKNIYEGLMKLIKIKNQKEEFNEYLEQLKQYEIISEKLKDLYDKNEARFWK